MKIFLKTLSSFYYERMIASAPSDFTEMVNMGMRLEEGKDGEAHAVTSHVKSRRPSVKRKTVRPASNQHQVAHIAPAFRENQHYQHQNQQQQHQQYQQPQHRPQQQAYQPRNNNQTSTIYDRKRVTFDPIPMTYAELYHSLIERKLITPRDPPAIPTNPQWWYKPELHYVYHADAPGHDVESCYPLKTKVQDLVRSGILFFKDVGPNVKKNPLSDHGKSAVNMVQGCPGKYKVIYVSHIRQSLVEMYRLLCGYNHYEHDHDSCRVCIVNERGCRQVRKDIQEMLDQGVIEILQNRDEDEVNVISPIFKIPEPVVIRYDGSKQKASPTLIIKPTGPVPYSSNKVVPYRYNTVALEDGKEVPLPSTSVVNIADVSGLTRSGRVLSAPPKPQADIRRADIADNATRPLGNSSSCPNPALAVDRHVVTARAPVLAGQNGMIREDCDEILRLIKRSEYNVVLDVAYVDHDVTIEQFDNIVANTTACNNLSFCDADLPEEGRDHNLELHISMNWKDDALSNVLVDTGSSLNVLPKSTLAKLSYQGPPMRQSGVVVKAFDGSCKIVIGETMDSRGRRCDIHPTPKVEVREEQKVGGGRGREGSLGKPFVFLFLH
ncbi:hypothetical protein KIW84_011578 [Lathyrus oleraceus]|uniref:Uncharacterized protein n=1 Tax=Pisum sativum TaxID=3888 RepID=A0A9D5BFC1_PEA|nr:hypothetical protein KIW84_011578 [Pisum sativum]